MEKGIGQAALSDLKGMAGGISRAVIYFPEVEDEEIDLTDAPPDSGGLSQAAGKLAQAAEKVRGKLNAVTKKITGLTTPAIQRHAFEVQFNPQTLQISARGGGRVPKTSYGEEGQGTGTIQYGSLDPYIEISVTLLFDAVNIQDAFLADKFTAGTTSALKGAGTALRVMAGKEYSVQPQVEGFLGALRDARRRDVRLQWGGLSYVGTMNHAGAKYTMFGPTGNPVRAELDITLMCMGKDYLNYWYDRYAGIMNVEREDAVTTKRLGDELGSLLNL